MGETFTKDTIREKHKQKVHQILEQGGGVEAIVNYLMSRIGTAISYERRKYERRMMAQWSKNDDETAGSRTYDGSRT